MPDAAAPSTAPATPIAAERRTVVVVLSAANNSLQASRTCPLCTTEVLDSKRGEDFPEQGSVLTRDRQPARLRRQALERVGLERRRDAVAPFLFGASMLANGDIWAVGRRAFASALKREFPLRADLGSQGFEPAGAEGRE